MHLYEKKASTIGIFRVSFQKSSEQLYNGKLRTPVCDFMYVKPQLQVKPQSQVIFVVLKYPLQCRIES